MCGATEETTDHFLFHCSAYEDVKKDTPEVLRREFEVSFGLILSRPDNIFARAAVSMWYSMWKHRKREWTRLSSYGDDLKSFGVRTPC